MPCSVATNLRTAVLLFVLLMVRKERKGRRKVPVKEVKESIPEGEEIQEKREEEEWSSSSTGAGFIDTGCRF
jgi:hypothetical protein